MKFQHTLRMALGSLAVSTAATLAQPMAPRQDPGSGFVASGREAVPMQSMSHSLPVQARLLADTTAVVPGRTFRVGLALGMEPGWCISWRNPGQDGIPTTASLAIPDGYIVSGPQWPIPQRFIEPTRQRTAFGYDGQVMLIWQVTPPDSLVWGQPVTLSVKASWSAWNPALEDGPDQQLRPKDVDLTVTLPTAPRAPVLPGARVAQPINMKLFHMWEVSMPLDGNAANCPAFVEIQGQLGPASLSENTVTAIIRWTGTARSVEVFPANCAAAAASDIQIWREPVINRQLEGRIQAMDVITMHTRVDPNATEDEMSLPIVVTFIDEQGTRRGITFNVPRTGATISRP